jgi:single-stranded-DNA-specific exonuclease
MEYQWKYIDKPGKQKVEALSSAINVNPFLASILIQRGIETFDQAKAFFRPKLESLHDPFLMKDMSKAVNRLTEAISNRENILLYGDYDVDGTTAVSLLYLFLKNHTDHLSYYIPDRYSEGYGLSKEGISKAIEKKTDLLLTLDCGIRAVDRILEAQHAGIDVIVCDHHRPGPDLPDAFAILDPKQNDCQYPFKELSGCGVGFKLLEAFCHQNTIDSETLFEFLDLLAVSIACDIVPIIDENRILTYYGLKKLNQKPSNGLKALLEISGKKPPLVVSDIVFSIGPRINATGRITHAHETVQLLVNENYDVESLASNLNTRNMERQDFDRSMTSEALEMIEKQPTEHSTVLFKPDWHKGVVGIVASRCIEHCYRPTIILTQSNGEITGSARSVEGFDIFSALEECADLLEKHGGHTHAAGLTLKAENLEKFQNRFDNIVGSRISPDQKIPSIIIDIEMPLHQITFKMASILRQMGPFGPHNMSPVFVTKNVFFKYEPKILKEAHFKGFVAEEEYGKAYEVIGFNLAQKINTYEKDQTFNIAYHVEENEYLGNKTLILNVKDIVANN